MIPLVYDVEATGLRVKYTGLSEPCSITDGGDEILQIGGLVLDEKMDPVRAFCHFCDTVTASSSAEAYATHEIKLEEIRDRLCNVFVEEVITTRCPEMLADDTVFIGYNTDYDLRMTATGLRNIPGLFKQPAQVTTRINRKGRQYVDLMKYYPERRKLVQRVASLQDRRDAFFSQYGHKLPFETNYPELFLEQWGRSHNALWDVIDTYLLFKEEVWRKKLF